MESDIVMGKTEALRVEEDGVKEEQSKTLRIIVKHLIEAIDDMGGRARYGKLDWAVQEAMTRFGIVGVEDMTKEQGYKMVVTFYLILAKEAAKALGLGDKVVAELKD